MPTLIIMQEIDSLLGLVNLVIIIVQSVLMEKQMVCKNTFYMNLVMY